MRVSGCAMVGESARHGAGRCAEEGDMRRRLFITGPGVSLVEASGVR